MAAIPENQWELLAGFKSGGEETATLREVIDPSVPTTSLPDLTDEECRELVIKRLENAPDFTIHLIGVGEINKERAIKEIKEQTSAGKTLLAIERRVISNMLKKAQPPQEEGAE